MKQDTSQEKQIPPSPKKGMSDFIKGFLLTAIPGIVAGVVGAGITVGTSTGSLPWQATDYWLLFILFIWPLCFTVFIVTMWIGLKRETFKTQNVRSGVLAGIGVALVSFGLSCLVPALSGS